VQTALDRESPRASEARADGPLAETLTVTPGVAHSLRQSAKSIVRSLSARTTLAVIVFAWACVFGVTASLRHISLLTQRYDLGNMTQAVWNTAHGRFLEVTEVGGEQVNRLGIHFDPILALFAPLWWIWPSPLMLLVVQTVALALGALPVFWLARKHLGSQSAGVKLALVYLLFPPLQWNALHEFHAVALAVPLLLAAIWYLDERRLVPFALCALGAALTKEQIGAVIAILGLWHAARSKQVRAGLAIAVAGTAWTGVALGVVIPHFSGAGSPYQARYDAVGGGPLGLLRTTFSDPGQIVELLTRPSNAIYLVFLGLPLLGMCFLSPLVLAATPQFAISMLSLRTGDTDLAYQNALPVIPVVVAAAIFGAARIARNPGAVANRILVASIGVALLFGPVRFLGSLGQIQEVDRSPARVAAQRQALALIPPEASVSATNRLGGQLAERRYLYVFPVVARAQWVVVDLEDAWLPARRSSTASRLALETRDGFQQPSRMIRIVDGLKKDSRWSLVFERMGILVFARAAPT
jgi:uncharacterized membrane protein